MERTLGVVHLVEDDGGELLQHVAHGKVRRANNCVLLVMVLLRIRFGD